MRMDGFTGRGEGTSTVRYMIAPSRQAWGGYFARVPKAYRPAADTHTHRPDCAAGCRSADWRADRRKRNDKKRRARAPVAHANTSASMGTESTPPGVGQAIVRSGPVRRGPARDIGRARPVSSSAPGFACSPVYANSVCAWSKEAQRGEGEGGLRDDGLAGEGERSRLYAVFSLFPSFFLCRTPFFSLALFASVPRSLTKRDRERERAAQCYCPAGDPSSKLSRKRPHTGGNDGARERGSSHSVPGLDHESEAGTAGDSSAQVKQPLDSSMLVSIPQ